MTMSRPRPIRAARIAPWNGSSGRRIADGPDRAPAMDAGRGAEQVPIGLKFTAVIVDADAARHHADVVETLAVSGGYPNRSVGKVTRVPEPTMTSIAPADPGRKDHDGFEPSAVQRHELGQAPVKESK